MTYGIVEPKPRPRKSRSFSYPDVNVSASPTVMPPTSAPVVESSPPRMAAGKALRASRPVLLSRPGVGKAVRKMLATAARAPAMVQAIAETRHCLMPISAAASRSSA